MKRLKIINSKAIFYFILAFTFFACDNNNDIISNDITGTYIGTITSDIASKSVATKSNNTATAIVSKVGDKIEVHCFDDNFDETIILDTYHYNDSIMVCLTGNDFNNMYGHMMGQGSMNENMHHSGSEWMQHLNNEHEDSDEHFGGFDMQHHSFNYTFRMSNGDFHFQGTKN